MSAAMGRSTRDDHPSRSTVFRVGPSVRKACPPLGVSCAGQTGSWSSAPATERAAWPGDGVGAGAGALTVLVASTVQAQSRTARIAGERRRVIVIALGQRSLAGVPA